MIEVNKVIPSLYKARKKLTIYQTATSKILKAVAILETIS